MSASAPPAALTPTPTSAPARRQVRWLRWGLGGLMSIAALAYASMLAWLWSNQEALLFHPRPLPAAYAYAMPPDVHEFKVDVPGAQLDGLALQLPHPRGVMFFLHGNNGNLTNWFVHTEFFRELNYDLVMIDYRGYGKSTGHIENEAQLHADVRAAWQQVAPQYAGVRRVVYGRSLGTGLAAALAGEVQPDLTVLVSPYESMVAMARGRYPWVPSLLVRLVLRYPLHTDEALRHVKTPVLLMHGTEDTLIPAQHSERLFAEVPQAKLVRVAGAGHGDIHMFPAYLQALRDALNAL